MMTTSTLMMKVLRRLRSSPAVTIFLVAFLSYAYFYHGAGMNEAARLDSIRAAIENGNLVVDQFAYNSADLIKVNGHYYSGKAPGTFYLGLVPFAATRFILSLTGLSPDVTYHWACYAASALSIGFLGALSLVFIYWTCLCLGGNRSDSAAVALMIGFGTMHFPFSTLFFSHVAASFCLSFAFYQLLTVRLLKANRNSPQADAIVGSGAPEKPRLLAAGFALGFAITLEYPSAIGAGLVGLYALQGTRTQGRFNTRNLTHLCLGAFLGLLPLFIYNIAAFGNAFFVTYEAYARDANSAFKAHQQGVLGIRIPLWDRSAWPQFLSNLSEITYRPLRGLFFNNPLLIMIFAGFLLLASRSRRILTVDAKLQLSINSEIILSLMLFLAYLTFNAGFGDSITYWGGGASFGPRYLIVTLPFLAIPLLACLQQRLTRWALFGLAVFSTLYCLMATAIEPRTPYYPPNPLTGFYLPRFALGELNINKAGIFSHTPMVNDSVAFNLGGLIGLKSGLQLLPLYIVWVLMMLQLDVQLSDEPKPRFAIAAAIVIGLAAAIPLSGFF